MTAKLSECVIGAERYLVVSDDTGRMDAFKGQGYDLARASVRERENVEHILRRRSDATQSARLDVNRYVAPFVREEWDRTTVSSFGNTHIKLNGDIFGNKPLDWYYKGAGASLKTTGSPLVLPIQGHGGGIEIEYALVLMTNATGDPTVIGYTLALDFSDVVMRHRHPNLAGLSKLADTFVAHDIVLATKIPASSEVTCVIDKGEHRKWAASGILGTDNMNCSVSSLLDQLINTNFFQPYCVHYILLGAAISTHKGGYDLDHGDVIQVRSQSDGLSLCCRYEDDAINFACA